MDAAKKSNRAAADGLVAYSISTNQKEAALVEINSETDFVARNEQFQQLVTEIANQALVTPNILNAKINQHTTIADEIKRLISLVGENITFRRAEKLYVEKGIVSAYIHNTVGDKMGKLGVLVALEEQNENYNTKLDEFGRKLAMHIAAANPTYLCQECIPQDVITKEKEIVIAQAKNLGKDENIANKMAEGRIKKFFEETVLLEQIYVIDNKTKVIKVVEAFNKEHGCNVKISGYKKFVLGEGIDKSETNFVAEVNAFLK
jgi:elongation factor Ts